MKYLESTRQVVLDATLGAERESMELQVGSGPMVDRGSRGAYCRSERLSFANVTEKVMKGARSYGE